MGDSHGRRIGNNLLQANRIIVILSIVVDSTDSVHEHQFAGHEAPKPIIEIFIFGKPPVAAEIEFESFIFESRRQAADIAVSLENRDAYVVLA